MPPGPTNRPKSDPDRPVPPAAGALHRLEADFFARMKPQHVYALKVWVEKAVSLAGPPGPPPGGAVVYRPVIAGALVTPAERAVSLSNPGEVVTFHVTPLAFGELPDARVEYTLPGQPMRSLPLPMRGVGHAWTARLLFLLLVVPVLLFTVRGAKSWATPAEADGVGGFTERLRTFLPEWLPLREGVTSLGQSAVDALVVGGGAMRASFFVTMLLAILLAWTVKANSVRHARKSSDGFGLHPVGNVGSNPRTLPAFLESVGPDDE